MDSLKQMMMMFEIGDHVSVLDDDINGVIEKIDGQNITIETNEGFKMIYAPNELISAASPDLARNMFLDTSISEVLSEKETPKRKQIAKPKKKEREIPAMEVDLHIHQLVGSTKGMSNHEMLTLQLDTARRRLEFAIKKRIPRIVFIHGVGEGVLKLELEYLFGRYNNVAYQEANYQKYGSGATEVRIFQSR